MYRIISHLRPFKWLNLISNSWRSIALVTLLLGCSSHSQVITGASAEQIADERTSLIQKEKEIAEMKAQLRLRMEKESQLYIGAVKRSVSRHWTPPEDIQPGASCEVVVHLAFPNKVVDVTPADCDTALEALVREAIYKTSPFPKPSHKSIFKPRLTLTFSLPALVE